MLDQMTNNHLELDDIRYYISNQAEKEKQAKEFLRNGPEVKVQVKEKNSDQRLNRKKSFNNSNSIKSSELKNNSSYSVLASNPDILKKSKTAYLVSSHDQQELNIDLFAEQNRDAVDTQGINDHDVQLENM